MNVFIDIDGTMTGLPASCWGTPRPEVIEQVKKCLKRGDTVVVWTGGGRKYAEEFVKKNGLQGAIPLAKPDLIVDDNAFFRLRSGQLPRYLTPEEFVEETRRG